ncbi:MAG: nicotinate phosphoribosyltransferase [Alyxoria varia]|nr:MAG: nicotinate phosphoribosyltransferase [Alyxoria varia]
MASSQRQDAAQTAPLPEGIFSVLDTDLYKLTMQSAVLKYFPDVEVTYSFTNRTPHLKLSRDAFGWLQLMIQRLENITLSQEEHAYLKSACPFFSDQYLHYLKGFRFRPKDHLAARFTPDVDNGRPDDVGQVEMHTSGLWVETILYEIPLLALTSEAYFKFCDRDWTHERQKDIACDKGLRLVEAGCMVSEFGTRRRRDYHTMELVIKGLKQAQSEGASKSHKGRISGTSNVHFAMKYDLPPIGTVAHEWFMGVAAVTENYEAATETALNHWIGTFGKGVLAIALTDTFGTSDFLKAFAKPIPRSTIVDLGVSTTLPSAATHAPQEPPNQTTSTNPPIAAPTNGEDSEPSTGNLETYADVFAGVRQDSGDPLEFARTMRKFYDEQKIQQKKTIVFSDSLNVDRCIDYQAAAEKLGFQPSFGVGTFFTNDFKRASDGITKSPPLNIVIKLSSANGRPAVKISDNMGKNTGDSATVAEIKQKLGYTEREWSEGDERRRW